MRPCSDGSQPNVPIDPFAENHSDPMKDGRVMGASPGRADLGVPASRPPSAAPLAFEVKLVKTGDQSFGLAHVPMEDGTQTLLVVDLRDIGPVARYNAKMREMGNLDAMLQRGDRIVAVGETRGDLEKMRELLRKDSCHIFAERWPEVFSVRLEKAHKDDKFGIKTETILKSVDHKVLRVSVISLGLVHRWNTDAQLSKRFHEIVVPGMEIEKVNGIESNIDKMHEALLTLDSVTVDLRRPDPDEFR